MVGRAAVAGVQGALTVPDEQLRQRAKRPQAADHAEEQVGRLP